MVRKSRELLELILAQGIHNGCVNVTEVAERCGIIPRTMQSAIRRGYLTDYQAKLFVKTFGCDDSVYTKLVRGSDE